MSTRAQNTIFIEEAMYKQRRMPHRASVISSTLRTETPARYISMRAYSTLLSLRRYRSMMAVSKETPLRRGTWRVTSPEVVVRFRS